MQNNEPILSSGAKDTYQIILQNVYDFSVDAALLLDEKVENLLIKLTTFKNLCPASIKISRYRRCFVDKHISMIYEIQNEIVVVVAFIDNRMKHDF
jgi:hypothetical protein